MRVLRGIVTAVDPTERRVIADGSTIGYDTLVLATGATHGYFGHEEWAVYAPGLKSIRDATSIRSRILDAFEKAEATEDAALQRELLTFLICGGRNRQSRFLRACRLDALCGDLVKDLLSYPGLRNFAAPPRPPHRAGEVRAPAG